MLLCADAEATSAALASGALACPSCGTGRLVGERVSLWAYAP